MEIVLIGSGKAGMAIGRACYRAGYKVLQVYSRNQKNALNLSTELESEPISHWEQITPDADLYVLALPDTVLESLTSSFLIKKGLVVHTAGAISMEIFKPTYPNYGVLYPLQSLTTAMETHTVIPLLIDANTPENKALLYTIAKNLSPIVAMMGDEQRLKLHAAAVWANNFTNHMYSIAHKLCNHFQIDFSLLIPMIEHTAQRLSTGNPETFQTGPAMRGDKLTMEKHLSLMGDFPEYQDLYRQISKSIERGD
jgi:predicted short-subunit dehydrogenase-like oxidoreductase (DUF2520 family)